MVDQRPLTRSRALLARERAAVGNATKIRFHPFLAAEAEGVRVRDADDLAERLAALLPGSFDRKAWFGATGSDANDALARLVPIAAGSAALSVHQAQARAAGSATVTKVPYPYPSGPCDPQERSLRYLGAASPAAGTAGVLLEAVQSDDIPLGGGLPPSAVRPQRAPPAWRCSTSCRARTWWATPRASPTAASSWDCW